MQSAIAICNVALTTYLGARSITALGEPSPEAEQCNLHYDRVRQSLLQRWAWVFAGTREALVQMAENDREETWAYRYTRPAKMIAVRWVNDLAVAKLAMSRGITPDSPREMTAGSIYSDVPGAHIEFTRDAEDPTEFPPAFADAFAASLAAAIAMPITRDASKVKAANDYARGMLDEAMVLDFNSRPATEQTFYPPQLQVRGFV